MEKQTNTIDSATTANDTPKVTGIGGIFFFSDDPEKNEGMVFKKSRT